MRKLIIFVVLAALIFYVGFRDNSYNPYLGTYESASNLSWVLKLNKDNSFELYHSAGKVSDFTKGKYQVEDNNITLTPDKDNAEILINDTLHGKIYGSMIKITETDDDFIRN